MTTTNRKPAPLAGFTIEKWDRGAYVIRDGRIVAEFKASCGAEVAECHANADLFASAPDLLAACERLAAAVAGGLDCHDPSAMGTIVAGAMDDARAAIAKARGEVGR